MLAITRLSRVQRAAALVASVAIVGLVSTSAAVAAPVAAPVTVTAFSPTTNYDSCGSSAIANNSASGVTLAAWPGSEYVGPSAPLQVAIIGANGAVGTPETFQPDAGHELMAQGDCNPLSVDAGPNGGFIVTWMDGDDNAIYGILVDSGGLYIGSAFTISSNTNYDDIETVSAAWSQADSRYLVTWKAEVSVPFPAALDSQQIVGRFIDESGLGIGSDFLVTDTANGFDNSQDLAYGAGTWIAVATEQVTNSITAVTVSAAAVVGAPLTVPSPGGSANGPSIVFNSSTSQFLVAARAGTTLWQQLLDSSGAITGAPGVFATGTGFNRPQVDSLGAAGYIATWHDFGGVQDVLAIELTTAGAPVGSPEFVSAGLADELVESNFRPEVAFSAATGQAYIIWSRLDVVADETNLVIRAWGAAIDPALAATGVDEDRTMIAAGGAVLALLVGLGFVIRRRRAKA